MKCPGCARPLAIKRFAAHLGKCIGPNGRTSGRAAQIKMNGGGLTSSQNSNPSISTPPGSRRGTPVPGKKTSPQKRQLDEFDENEDSEEEPKKKKRKLPIKKRENISLTKPTKKWKSGRLDGKMTLALSHALTEPDGDLEDKFLKPTLDKTESVSSQTLSSP